MGEWVTVEDALEDPDWNRGRWRVIEKPKITEYMNGLIDVDEKYEEPKWQKWVATVPTQQGLYADKFGDLWILTPEEDWKCFDSEDGHEYGSAITDIIDQYMPLRRVSLKIEED